MDRKGKQKISFICLILVAISLFAAIFFCKVSYEKKIYEESGYELKKFFNTSGVKYRELGLKEVLKTATEDEMLDLLASDGKLIKRPLLVDGSKVLIGFKENEYKENLL